MAILIIKFDYFFYICVLQLFVWRKKILKKTKCLEWQRRIRGWLRKERERLTKKRIVWLKLTVIKKKGKEKKKKEKRGKVMRKNERIFIGTFNFIYIKL